METAGLHRGALAPDDALLIRDAINQGWIMRGLKLGIGFWLSGVVIAFAAFLLALTGAALVGGMGAVSANLLAKRLAAKADTPTLADLSTASEPSPSRVLAADAVVPSATPSNLAWPGESDASATAADLNPAHVAVIRATPDLESGRFVVLVKNLSSLVAPSQSIGCLVLGAGGAEVGRAAAPIGELAPYEDREVSVEFRFNPSQGREFKCEVTAN